MRRTCALVCLLATVACGADSPTAPTGGSRGDGDGGPGATTERACTVTNTETFTGSRASLSRDRYIPVFDLRFRCEGGTGAATNIWGVVRLWQDLGGVVVDDRFHDWMLPGQHRWLCGGATTNEDIACTFGGQANLLRSNGGFDWKARWNYCLEGEGCGDPPFPERDDDE